MTTTDTERQKHRVAHSQAAGLATRELTRQRRAALEANPIDWDERIARLLEIFDELETPQ